MNVPDVEVDAALEAAAHDMNAAEHDGDSSVRVSGPKPRPATGEPQWPQLFRSGRRTSRPLVLVPFDKREAITPEVAASIADRSPETVRGWCARYVGKALPNGELYRLAANDWSADPDRPG